MAYRRYRGFSLVELLVCIGIICLLLSIATAVYFKALKKANWLVGPGGPVPQHFDRINNEAGD